MPVTQRVLSGLGHQKIDVPDPYRYVISRPINAGWSSVTRMRTM
jgi:hypothetical protein